MKTKLSALLACCIIPVVLSAQPTITTNEFYRIGSVMRMVNCDPGTVNAGGSGAGQTWDFSGVVASGGTSVTSVALNTNTEFNTANLAVTLPNGDMHYMKVNSGESYLQGVVSGGVKYNYNDYITSKRPFTYNSSYVDSYTVVVTSPLKYGTGFITVTGDAYGTLKLPTGTFNNVLRVKKYQTQSDSVSGMPSGYSSKVSYLWFDAVHASPLFRIDSASGTTSSGITAMYLENPLAVNDVAAPNTSYSGYLGNNTLVLAGDFRLGKEYNMILNNVIGNKVMEERFVATDNVRKFIVNGQLKPGIYMVSLSEIANPSSRVMIKLMNQ